MDHQDNILRLRVTVRGAVQGVGFRPFVYRLAAELGCAGWVRNSAQGVFIEVEPGVEGLVHQTELADGSFSLPKSDLRSGTPVSAIILPIAPESHHLSLSLRESIISA